MGKVKYIPAKSNEWISPVHRGYQMACCDCGLVHEMDFKIELRKAKNGRVVQCVIFRARRNNSATAAHRRRKEGHARSHMA